jgi:energy-coupling factor transporter ATP-binding protein EcfA2
MGPSRVRLAGWGFRHASRRAWAVRDVDLEIDPGQRVLLTGASGSGKSTLLRALGGLLEPESGDTAGELSVDGALPGRRRQRVGMVFQDPDSQLVMTRSGDDVAFGLENAGTPPDLIWPAVDTALDAVGFDLGRDRATAALSGGQKQRLVLAGALAARPGLLLLDEPRSWSSTTTWSPGCPSSTGWWSCSPPAGWSSTARAGRRPRCGCPTAGRSRRGSC